MTLTTWQDWIAWAGIVLPLVSLAWAAVFYVLTRRREVQHQEFERFFRVMDHLGASGSIASKMAAAYELRKYPQYAPVIIRLCEQARIEGPASEMLQKELELTAAVMKKE